ncbi:cytochrome P450 [Novosphingobium taihuense]|uniref:Cytochrome P450 n=1 Tax=Novosphingobium taihuense TaxID=260085 RepID=A0A7W7EUD1_9SPHN|nr:cytochrome P450 [Novosphingobium taihuense]MBB4614283.1 cytochrome P450 [Novosphingobium taihuense]
MAKTIVERPAHVPPELVVDADIYDLPGGDHDPHMAWKALDIPGNPGFVWTPHNGGHWIVTSADLLWELYPDLDRVSCKDISIPPSESPLKLIPAESDEPEHHYYRKIVLPFVGPKAVRSLMVQVRAMSAQLIDGFLHRGSCEFMTEFARHVPMRIFLSLVNLPDSDREWLVDLVDRVIRPQSEEDRTSNTSRMAAYLGEWIEKRRSAPGKDLLSAIIHAKVGDRPMNELEVLGECMDVMFGGLDTVASMMGFIMNFLATHPDHYRTLVESPERIPLAVEEMLRRFAVANPGRRIVQDIERQGYSMKAGDMLVLASCLHGLDDARWGNAATVDFDRKRSTHCTFGTGVHNCPGAGLARSEIAIMLEEWIARVPAFGLDPDQRVITASGAVNGVVKLPLIWPC